MTNKLSKKIVLITGGAGFIGLHLSRALLDTGAIVHILDNLSGGKKENVPRGASFHKVDIRHLTELKKTFKKIGHIDYVFHLAAIPEVEISIKDPINTNEVNVIGTENVLRISHESGVKRLVFASSAAVYGNTTDIPIQETTLPKPVNPYGFQKLISEHYCAIFSNTYGLETVCLRYFNVYGPNQPVKSAYSAVISVFLAKAKRGESLTVTGDGLQTRDFVHVSDIAQANILAAVSSAVGHAESINIGSGKGISIKDLAELISTNIEYTTPRNEIKKSVSDISKAQKLLGWSPVVSIEKGLSKLKKIK